MIRIARRLLRCLLAGCAAAGIGAAWDAASAEEGLSGALLERVFPGAEYAQGPSGEPPATPVFRDGALQGYVFSTHEVLGSVGYSGKPLDIVVGLDLAGVITGATIREHHEPILIIGIKGTDLDRFVSRYAGLDIRATITLEPTEEPGGVHVDAISGASISSLMINDAILRAARTVARARGILAQAGSIDIDRYEPAGWNDLVADGSVSRLTITNEKAGSAAGPSATLAPDDLFIELFAALATPARIGRNLLGARAYDRLMAELPAGGHAVIVAARGRYSFKGTEYARSGVFDRIQFVQGDRTFRPTEAQHRQIDAMAAPGAPGLREAAIFVFPKEWALDPAAPWRLELFVADAAATAGRQIFMLPYVLPELYRLAAPLSDSAGPASGALWQQSWQQRKIEIALVGTLLFVLTLVLIFQDFITRRARLYFWFRNVFLAVVLVGLGWVAGAQLSVVNVLTFVQAVRTEFNWEFFLIDPLMFILWSYVAVAMVFLGRGVFCGWLCPFGALQELLNKAARALRVPQLQVPFGVHERLWPIKYVVFILLFALSFYSLELTVLGAEIEPFKTAIVLRFMREWSFVLFPVALLVAGLFIERFYCRYLCPLGAALALPARLRMFEWLKRKWQCGRECHICATRCTVQAIHPDGHINPNECIHCLNCQVLYHDERVCPPLIARRKRREARSLLRSGTAAQGPGAQP